MVHLDNLGNVLTVGCEVYYVHNLWRGRDELRKGKVLTMAGSTCTIETYDNGELVTRRAKYTKVGRI